MKPSSKVILAPNGIPWCALLAWCAVVAAGMVAGLNVIHSTTVGGTFVIAATFGNMAFAAMLGRRWMLPAR